MKGQIILDSGAINAGKPQKLIRHGLRVTVTTEGGRGGRRKTTRYEIKNKSSCKMTIEYEGHNLGLGGVALKALDPGEIHVVTPARGGRMTAIHFDQL